MSNFDPFAGRYSNHLEQLLGKVGASTLEFAQLKSDRLCRLAEQFCGPTRNLRLLDLGCGPGNVTLFLQEQFAEVVAADISHELLKEAATKAPRARLVPLEPGPLPFADDEFDVAFCAGVWHHLRDDEIPPLCAEMARVVRPGGLVVLFEHNPYNPVTRKIVSECELDHDVERLVPAKQGKAFFSGAGLEIVSSCYYAFFPGLLRSLRPLEPYLEWLPLGGQYALAGRKPLKAVEESPQAPALSVIMPMYNEEDNVIPVSRSLLNAFQEADISIELVLVDNGSRDATPSRIEELRQTYQQVRHVTVPVNQGYGWGIISGLWAATGQSVALMGGDGQVTGADVIRTYRAYLETGADLAKVTRVVRGDGPWRQLVSKIYNGLFLLLFGMPSKDVNGTPKIFRRHLLPRLALKSKDWFIDAELYLKLGRKGKVVEVPIEFLARASGSSSVRTSTLLEFLVNMSQCWISQMFARLQGKED